MKAFNKKPRIYRNDSVNNSVHTNSVDNHAGSNNNGSAVRKQRECRSGWLVFLCGNLFCAVLHNIFEIKWMNQTIFFQLDSDKSNIDEDMALVLTAPSKQHHNKNDTIIDDNVNFRGVIARPYDPWPIQEYPLPCYKPHPSEVPNSESFKTKDRGFLFAKPMKVGGSTANGVQLRIAERIPAYQNKSFPRCQVSYGHNFGFYFQNRTIHESFLWTMLRDPTERIVSQFFHFYVSREKVEPTDKNFQALLTQSNRNGIKVKNYYINQHRFRTNESSAPSSSSSSSSSSPSPPMRASKFDAVEAANQIMNDYDFIGITERFDESIVVMQLLLGLNTIDVMYLSAKGSGGFDDGGYKRTCFYIVPSFISPGMKEYFSSFPFQYKIKYDQALYDAANRSLDLTIDTVIGRRKFENELHKFLYAKRIVHDICIKEAQFPCSAGGTKQRPACLNKDEGCGDRCITQVMKRLEKGDKDVQY